MNPGAYAERHAQVLVGALGRMAQRPVATILIILVIGIALALPLLLQLLIQNARQAAGNWDQGVELSLYLRPGLEEARARQITASLRNRGDIAAVQLVTAAQALQDFKEHSGFGAALDLLGGNPLPAVLVVTPAVGAAGAAGLAALKLQLAAIDGVEQVQLDTDWVKRLQAMLNLLRRLVALVAVALVAGIVAIVGTVIRLDVANRQREIEVMKLVGGTDAFARRPFLYSGALFGLMGAGLALLLVALARHLLAGTVHDLAATYGSDLTLSAVPVGWGLGVLAGAAALGWLAAWGAATGQIRRIDPT